MKIWQLSTGPNDYDDLMKLFSYEMFSYEKGRAKMTTVPEFSDQVYITCRAELIAKARIVSESKHGFLMSLEYVYPEGQRQKMKGYRRNWIDITQTQKYLLNAYI